MTRTRHQEVTPILKVKRHQTGIVLLGFYIVTWPINSGLRYVAIVLTSMVTAFVIYDVAVRRTRLTRFLFGMKPPARSPK